MKRISLHKVMAKLAEEPKVALAQHEVTLSKVQDAEALYNKIVKGAQAQASILSKVENELKALAQDAKKLITLEQEIEVAAKTLGINENTYFYEANVWASDLKKYANEVGVISNKL